MPPDSPPLDWQLRAQRPVALTWALEDVADFQDQMGHAYDGPPRVPPLELIIFRLNFLGEELRELGTALGIDVHIACRPRDNQSGLTSGERTQALADALDALVDMEYVLLGTALQLGLRRTYGEAWQRVHAANLKKVAGRKESRGFAKDVVKPGGWIAPDLRDLVR